MGMTREEAIRELKIFNGTTRIRLSANFWEALNIAIKALEQEPCEDWCDVPSDEMTLEQARQAVKDLRKMLAEYLWQEPCEDVISRQAVIDVIERWLKCSDYNEAERHIMRAIRSILYDLPSINPVSNISIQITEREKYGRFN